MQHQAQTSAGLLWLCAGLAFLTAEAITAHAFPGYSYAHNYISDLGVPYAGEISGRALRSTLAPLMNWGGFILDGTLYAAAAIIAAKASPKNRLTALFLVLALAHSLGTILVGTIHSGNRELADGTHQYHMLGAGLAIIGGNAALFAAAGMTRQWGLPIAYATACRALGVVGFVGLALLETTGHALPEGLLERVSVYAITSWEILTGITLLCAAKGVWGKPSA